MIADWNLEYNISLYRAALIQLSRIERVVCCVASRWDNFFSGNISCSALNMKIERIICCLLRVCVVDFHMYDDELVASFGFGEIVSSQFFYYDESTTDTIHCDGI